MTAVRAARAGRRVLGGSPRPARSLSPPRIFRSKGATDNFPSRPPPFAAVNKRADYRGALNRVKARYEIATNANVLYNVVRPLQAPETTPPALAGCSEEAN